jgi:hypothetical protein
MVIYILHSLSVHRHNEGNCDWLGIVSVYTHRTELSRHLKSMIDGGAIKWIFKEISYPCVIGWTFIMSCWGRPVWLWPHKSVLLASLALQSLLTADLHLRHSYFSWPVLRRHPPHSASVCMSLLWILPFKPNSGKR